MRKIIDISLMLEVGHRMHTPIGTKDVQFQLEVIKERDAPGGAGQIVRAIHARAHTGCHIDAPEHMVKDGKHIHELPLETFIGPAVVANLTHKVPGGAITSHDLEKAVGSYIQEGDRLLLHTGWNNNFGKPNYAEGSPYLAITGIHWCVEKKLTIVGFDFAHAKDDPASPSQYYTSRYLLENGVLTLTSLCNLDKISHKRVELICFPLHIRDIEASLVRAVVLEES